MCKLSWNKPGFEGEGSFVGKLISRRQVLSFSTYVDHNSVQWIGHYPECRIYFTLNVVQVFRTHSYLDVYLLMVT